MHGNLSVAPDDYYNTVSIPNPFWLCIYVCTVRSFKRHRPSLSSPLLWLQWLILGCVLYPRKSFSIREHLYVHSMLHKISCKVHSTPYSSLHSST